MTKALTTETNVKRKRLLSETTTVVSKVKEEKQVKHRKPPIDVDPVPEEQTEDVLPFSAFMKSPGIKRLAMVAQINKISKRCCNELMAVSDHYIRNVVHKACIMTEHSRKTTVGQGEVLEALKLYNVRYYGNSSPEYFAVNKMPKMKKESAKLNHYRKNAHQLYLARKPLVRHIKAVSEEVVSDYRFSPRAIDVIQEVLERTLVRILCSAHLIAQNHNAKTVQMKDIRVVMQIRAMVPDCDSLMRCNQ